MRIEQVADIGDDKLHDPDRIRSGSEIRNVIAMAIPVVITTSSRALMDIADFIMITWVGLDEVQAAILPAQMVMWSYIVTGLGFVSVVNTFASQSLGKGRLRDCSGYAWQVFYIAATAALFAFTFRPWLGTLIAAFGHSPAVQTQEIAYLRVAMFTIGPSIAANGLGWFFVGIHRPWTTMWSALEANVVNVVVSLVLIFGYLGFEPMGIAGAAWGTVVATTYRTVRLALTLMSPSMNERFQSRQTWRISWSKLKDLWRVGSPCAMHWVSEVIVWALFVNVLIGAKFGTAPLIATNIAWQYMRLSFMPTLGVGQALTALVGKSIGAGDPGRAERETRFAAIVTMVYMGVLSILYAFFGSELIGLFNDHSDVVGIGAKIMLCAAVFQLFDALGITYNAALRGAGDTFVPSMFFVVSTWVIVIGFGWAAVVLVPQWGALGPWLAASGFIVVSGVFLWWRWRGRAWMKISIFRATESTPVPGAAAGKAVAKEFLGKNRDSTATET